MLWANARPLDALCYPSILVSWTRPLPFPALDVLHLIQYIQCWGSGLVPQDYLVSMGRIELPSVGLLPMLTEVSTCIHVVVGTVYPVSLLLSGNSWLWHLLHNPCYMLQVIYFLTASNQGSLIGRKPGFNAIYCSKSCMYRILYP